MNLKESSISPDVLESLQQFEKSALTAEELLDALADLKQLDDDLFQQFEQGELTKEELYIALADRMRKEMTEPQKLPIWEYALKDVIETALKKRLTNLGKEFSMLKEEISSKQESLESVSIWMTELCPRWADMSVENTSRSPSS